MGLGAHASRRRRAHEATACEPTNRSTINEITLVRGESAQAEGFSGRAEWMWSIGAVPGHRPRAGWWTTNDRRNSSQLCNLNKKRPKRIMVEILAPGAAHVKLNNNRILRLQSLERLVCARARKQVNNPIGCSMQRLPPSPVEVGHAVFKGFPQSLGVHIFRWEYGHILKERSR